jgi:hypothetical protein
MQKYDENSCFVQYNPDLWCHIYEDVIALPIPFKVTGQMGFFNVPDVQVGINLSNWYNEQIKENS